MISRPLMKPKQSTRPAREPKKLVILPGAYHHDVYLDPLFAEVMKIILEWLKEWMKEEKTC